MTITVGIAGITGRFGTLVAKRLLEDPHVRLRGYCRSLSKLSTFLTNEPRADIVQGDVDDIDSLRRFVSGSSVVICAYLGDNELMTEGQKQLVDACDVECVPRYIASDYCFDFTRLAYNEHPAKDPMKAIKEYIESKNNVQGVHVLIGAFMDTFWSQYFGAWDPQSETLSYWGSGKEVWESTSCQNAAEFVAAIALDTSATGMQRYLGDRKSTLEIAEVFAQIYGRKPNLKKLGSLDELFRQMRQRLEKNREDMFSWLALCYQYYCLNGQTYLGELTNKYALKPETFADYMRSRSPQKLGS